MILLPLLAAHPLVHVNATLNGLATLLLMTGFVLIRRRNEKAHKRAMLSAFGMSIAFLGCYLYYHLIVQMQTPFEHQGPIRYLYFAILITHVLLAMSVPFLASYTIFLGLRAYGNCLPAKIGQANKAEQQEYKQQYRTRHRRWANITFPIWLYVSVTGVVVYAMLYHL